jgi:hypothetical protein
LPSDERPSSDLPLAMVERRRNDQILLVREVTGQKGQKGA